MPTNRRNAVFFCQIFLHVLHVCGIMFLSHDFIKKETVIFMKLYFDKRLKDPTYYGQQGFRNGKKVSSKNIINFGKHSELLKITDDPETYVREQIRVWNEEYRIGRVEYTVRADFNERVKHTDAAASSCDSPNIGYFFIQKFMAELNLKKFFLDKTDGRKITFDCYTIHRFLTYFRILGSAFQVRHLS